MAGLAALVIGVQIQPAISIAGFVMMLVSAIVGISAWSRIEGQEETKRPSKPSGQASSSGAEDFMSKLEERWRKRQQGGDL